ncbi:MAG: recombination-associated protein RdgC [Pseudomonadales bacterium]|jgi:recombination associated protein RdgC
MLFKNAYLYRITSDFEYSSEELEQELEKCLFKPCSGIRPSSFGWISPLGDANGPLTHEVAGCTLLCAKREDKIVPPSALADVLAEKIERIEELEGRKIRSKEKLRLKDDALAELLPRALPRSKQIQGYISPADNLLVVGTSSVQEAELFINCLRESLGSFAVVPPQVKSKPTEVFTHWINTRKLPDHFELGDACDLVDLEDGGTVTCRKQDLGSQEIRSHIDAGKICTRIALRWHGDMRFTVDNDVALKQIKVESSDDSGEYEDDPIALLDAAFVNMTLEFGRLLPALFSALGGETKG